LQNTQRLIDETQLRLATGLKVNSALDSPQNFFAAQSLNNRAGDLTRLLDGISQSIRTIEEANTGVTALTDLLNQADSIVTQAREELSGSGSANATITGNVDLSGYTDDITDITGVDNGDLLRLFAQDADGDAVTLSSATVSFDNNDSIQEILTEINDITNTSTNEQVFKASLTEDGYLQIENLEGGKARIEFETSGNAINLDLAAGLGFAGFNVSEFDQETIANGANRAGITFTNTAAIESQGLYETENSNTVVADRSTLLTNLVDSDGSALSFSGNADANDAILLSIDGDSANAVDLGGIASLTIQGVVDAINDSSSLNTKIRASYNETTGKIAIEQIDSSITSIQLYAQDGASATAANIDFGFGLEDLDPVVDAANTDVESENLVFGTSSSVIAGLEEDYNTVLEQIDGIVSDASYRGVNLLGGDNLETIFNEDRSSTLLTTGVNFTASGLGLSAANFRNDTVALAASNAIADATDSVRAFGNTIANDLAVIQTRRDFTESTINTLEAGADDLTVADQNEEGANLLALQTRQTLGVTSLSLASQSQQAVLRLF
jgi:flagellin-like hook-associated protein FlgL